MKCSIILNGFNSEDNFPQMDKSYIIAVDGGIKHLYNRGIVPNVFIGDMDSIDKAIYDWAAQEGCKIITAPIEKDETDGQLAIKYALDKGFDFINFYFFDGGRPDHYISNIFLLKYLLKKNIKCMVHNNYGYYYPSTENSLILCEKGTTISILPLSKKTTLGECKGLKYPIYEGFVMHDDNPVGISNIALDDIVKINILTGACLVFVLNKNII